MHSALLAIDRICRQFETELKAGKEPRVEAFLGDVSESQRDELRRELESIQQEHGQESARQPTLAQFVQNLVASGLMTEDEIQTVLDDSPGEVSPHTAKDLAKLLHSQQRLTRFQTQAVYQGKTRGLVLGNYVVLEKLGRGGMGQVFKARHRRMERIVALKMLPAGTARSPAALKRFQREAKAAAQLSHPNIVTAYDADEADGIHFLVMEYVEGQDLAALIKKQGPLSAATAVDYIVQAGQGLDYAHRHGVVHRDIKPANILLDCEGAIKVLDMGLARVESGAIGDEALTSTGQVMGTLDFMAPEQAFDTSNVDARTDIYSLGCTLYFLLAGHSPFGGDTMTQKILAHREEPIPSLRELRSDVSENLEGIFRQMLAKSPAERQASMAEVVEQLSQSLTTGDDPLQDLEEPAIVGETGDIFADVTEDTSISDASSISLERSVVTPIGACTSDPSDASLTDQPSANPIVTFSRTAFRAFRDSGMPWLLAVTGVGVLGLAGLFLGIVFLLRDGDQTVRVEIAPEVASDATVTVWMDDRQMEIAGLGETIELKPGEHGYEIRRGDEVVAAREFAVVKGDNPALKITLDRSDDSVLDVSPEEDDDSGSSVSSGQVDEPRTSSTASSGGAPPLAIAPFDANQARRYQQAWGDYLRVPVEQSVDLGEGVALMMVLIPPGEFVMGSTEEERYHVVEQGKAEERASVVKRLPNEGPQHRVRISQPFGLSRHEVTRRQFRQFAKETGYRMPTEPGFPQTDDDPLVNVSWKDVTAFCQWLSKKLGATYRLPTEAEWEYACRAGTTTFWHSGDSEEAMREHGWFEANSGGKTHPVGQLERNAWGLFDMHGNAFEWCSDWCDGDYYRMSPPVDPTGPSTGHTRMLRGGHWGASVWLCRSACRRNGYPRESSPYVGFRLAYTVLKKDDC